VLLCVQTLCVQLKKLCGAGQFAVGRLETGMPHLCRQPLGTDRQAIRGRDI
jgi:hypothetical protein